MTVKQVNKHFMTTHLTIGALWMASIPVSVFGFSSANMALVCSVIGLGAMLLNLRRCIKLRDKARMAELDID